MALTLSAEDARELTYGGDFSDMGLTIECQRQIDKSRWESIHELVVRDSDGKFWRTTYRRGLTEMQESRPFEDETEVVFVLVEKVPVEAWEYQPVES